MQLELKIIKQNYKRVFYIFGIIMIVNAYIIFNVYEYIKNNNYVAVKGSIALIIVLILAELWLIQSIIYISLKKRKKEPYYILNKNGFYFKGIYKGVILEWDTIEKYEIIKFRGVDMLRISLKDEKRLYQQYNLIMKIFYKLNKYILQGNGFIFDLASFEGNEKEVIKTIKFYIH